MCCPAFNSLPLVSTRYIIESIIVFLKECCLYCFLGSAIPEDEKQQDYSQNGRHGDTISFTDSNMCIHGSHHDDHQLKCSPIPPWISSIHQYASTCQFGDAYQGTIQIWIDGYIELLQWKHVGIPTKFLDL